jgi:hypothetical protein
MDPQAMGASLLAPPIGGRFDAARSSNLPEPVRRYLSAAIAEGTPLYASTRLVQRGSIRVGVWVPYRAQQILAPHRGFVWWGRAGGVLTGFDRSVDGAGEMRWKALGLVSVVSGSGADFDRSAAGRFMAESIWLPTTLLPAFGVEWRADADDRIRAAFSVAGVSIDLELTIDDQGRVLSCVCDRWGDADDSGTFGRYRFGGEITGTATFGGLTIPSEGTFGWHFGTDRWDRGAFIRYRIERLDPVAAG